MEELFFFDCNCQVGESLMGLTSFANVADLFSEMDYYGVKSALIRHVNIERTALLSNQLIVDFMQEDKNNRLFGCWSILPSQCNELPKTDDFFAEMKKNRIAALTLSPFEHRYVPCQLTLGKILDAATERKIPILLDAFAGRWDDLYAFLKEFPDLYCIYLEKVGKWGSDRNIRPLLENYENFHFEISGYWVPGGVYDLVKKYGAERILYGSNLPRYNQGCSMLQLKQSGITDEEITKVAGKNLAKLIGQAEL